MAFSYLKCTSSYIYLKNIGLCLKHLMAMQCNIIIRKPVYSVNILLASICHRDIQTVNISVDTNFCCRFRLLYELP